MRVARRDPLLALGITDRRTGYPVELMVRAAEAGWTVVERDVPYGPRTGGEVEGERIASRQYPCGTGLLAGDLVIPVDVGCDRQGTGRRVGQDPTGGDGRRAAAADIAAASLLGHPRCRRLRPRAEAKVVALTGNLSD